MHGETRIVWLEPPDTLPFVRQTSGGASSRVGYPKRKQRGHNYRVVGFAELHPSVRGTERYWLRRIFTVRDYDRTPAEGGYLPSEGVDPLTIAPNVDGKVTDRCGAGSFPAPPTDTARRLSFWQFLRDQRHRDDPVGDLARDALLDSTFPRKARRLRTMQRYLQNYGACIGARKALNQAHAEWRATWPS